MYLGLGMGLLYRPMVVGAPAPSFAPTDIANLKLWLDSSDTSTITQIGGAVSQWNDKSGNGYNAVQATGTSRPLTGTRTINGLNVLDFDGINDVLTGTANAGLLSVFSSPFTTFVVAATDNTLKDQSLVIGYNSTPSRRIDLGYPVAGNAMVAMAGTTTTSRSIAVDTNPHILAARASTSLIYDGTAGGGTLSGAGTTVVNIGFGARSNAGNNQWDGVIAEILVYAAALSNSDTNLVGSYLSTKWGVTWTGL